MPKIDAGKSNETVQSNTAPKVDGGKATEASQSGAPADSKTSKRLTVDLSPEAAAQFQKLMADRGLTISQAVRQALSLLALYDDARYELILRDRAGKEADQRILLVK